MGTEIVTFDVKGWFDNTPRAPSQYPPIPGTTALFAKDRLYVDECSSFGCQGWCELTVTWHSDGRKIQTPQCFCKSGYVLSANGKSCEVAPPPKTYFSSEAQCSID